MPPECENPYDKNIYQEAEAKDVKPVKLYKLQPKQTEAKGVKPVKLYRL